MVTTDILFDGKNVRLLFNASFQSLETFSDSGNIVIITDENLLGLYRERLQQYKVIAVPAGEKSKTQSIIDDIIEQLLNLDADKTTLIVGFGGGVVTDIAGYVSAIYKRGTRLALVPASILAMTDAAVGGKNGINCGQYKNMIGTTKQPEYIVYDYSLLQTLPRQEWISGFAEIIKHACIKDENLFEELADNTLDFYIQNPSAVAALIERNVAIKSGIVINDVYEHGDRYLLNFGHTFGHAIENLYSLPHGYAVSIGMVMAAKISVAVNNLHAPVVEKIKSLLTVYELPVTRAIEYHLLSDALNKDKKRTGNAVNFVLLNKIGEATIKKLSFKQIEDLQNQVV